MLLVRCLFTDDTQTQKRKEISRVFELILHPGAVGGGTYDEEVSKSHIRSRSGKSNITKSLLTERRPMVTCFSIHPSGLFFAIGHVDGCISYWAVDDEDRPLAVKNLSAPFSLTDAHVPDPSAFLNAEESKGETKHLVMRVPVFKLSWSTVAPKESTKGKLPQDINGATEEYGAFGETCLTILGGTLATDPKGVTVLLFPAFALPVDLAQQPTMSDELHPATKQAMKVSLYPAEALQDVPDVHISTSHRFYPTTSPVEDFVLVPSYSPYLNGGLDPSNILLLSSEGMTGVKRKNVLYAFAFPPALSPRSTLPSRSRLPIQLCFSFPPKFDALKGAQIYKMDNRESFGYLIRDWVEYGDNVDIPIGKRIPGLRGGTALANFEGGNAPDAKLSKVHR